MDRLYRRYTLVAWFFTAYIAWEIVDEVIRSALGDSRFSRVYPHHHLSSHALYGLSILGLFDYVFWLVWMILLALLAWTVRSDYLSRSRDIGGDAYPAEGAAQVG